MKKIILLILVLFSLSATAQKYTLTNQDLTIDIVKNSTTFKVGKWLSNFAIVGDSVSVIYQRNQDNSHFTLYIDKDSVLSPVMVSSTALYDTLVAWTIGEDLSGAIASKVDSIDRRVDSVFYYTNGTEHFAFIDSTGGGGAGWALTGNAGTTAGTNFIGTTDNVDWVIKTNNTEKGRMDSDRCFMVGINEPVWYFRVKDTFLADTALKNTAVGGRAYYNYVHGVSTGENNAYFGQEAGFNGQVASRNTGLGREALFGVTNFTGTDNVALGFDCMHQITSGSFNVSAGASAGFSNTTGQENTALGYNALFSNQTTSEHVAVGAAALYNNTSGIQNTGIGNAALSGNTSGGGNTAVGWAADQGNQTGSRNTSIGHNAMSATGNHSDNVAVGHEGLLNTTTGSNNTAVGTKAGNVNATGNYNTSVGYQANPSANNLTNTGTFGALAISNCSNCFSYGDVGSNVSHGFHTTTPHSTLHDAGSFALKYNPQTANYTATAQDYLVVFTSNVDTLTLPTAVGITGRIYGCKVTGASACIVQGTGGQTIDGASDYALASQYKYVFIMSNGANWIVVGNN